MAFAILERGRLGRIWQVEYPSSWVFNNHEKPFSQDHIHHSGSSSKTCYSFAPSRLCVKLLRGNNANVASFSVSVYCGCFVLVGCIQSAATAVGRCPTLRFCVNSCQSAVIGPLTVVESPGWSIASRHRWRLRRATTSGVRSRRFVPARPDTRSATSAHRRSMD